MHGSKLVKGSAAVMAVAALALAGCSSSSSSGEKPAKKDTTTTTAAKGGDATTTTAADTQVDHPTDGMQAALAALTTSLQSAGTERNAAVSATDLDGAKAAIAKIRTAYFDFDKAVRELHASGSDVDKVNELLAVDGDVIDNLDEYASITDPADYNFILSKEDASVNEWRRLMRTLVADWKVDGTITPDSDLPSGYVGAGQRIQADAAAPVAYSMEVPQGFAGKDSFLSGPDLRGPKTAFVSGGIANADDKDAKPKSDAELKSFADTYATAVADKAAGQITESVSEVDAGDAGKAYAFTYQSADGVGRDVLFRTADGQVVDVSLNADDKDEFARFEARFDAMIESIKLAG